MTTASRIADASLADLARDATADSAREVRRRFEAFVHTPPPSPAQTQRLGNERAIEVTRRKMQMKVRRTGKIAALREMGWQGECSFVDLDQDSVERSGLSSAMICPINLTVMRDPHMAADGHCYDKDAITAWMHTSIKSPVTSKDFTTKVILADHTMKAVIHESVLQLMGIDIEKDLEHTEVAKPDCTMTEFNEFSTFLEVARHANINIRSLFFWSPLWHQHFSNMQSPDEAMRMLVRAHAAVQRGDPAVPEMRAEIGGSNRFVFSGMDMHVICTAVWRAVRRGRSFEDILETMQMACSTNNPQIIIDSLLQMAEAVPSRPVPIRPRPVSQPSSPNRSVATNARSVSSVPSGRVMPAPPARRIARPFAQPIVHQPEVRAPAPPPEPAPPVVRPPVSETRQEEQAPPPRPAPSPIVNQGMRPPPAPPQRQRPSANVPATIAERTAVERTVTERTTSEREPSTHSASGVQRRTRRPSSRSSSINTSQTKQDTRFVQVARGIECDPSLVHETMTERRMQATNKIRFHGESIYIITTEEFVAEFQRIFKRVMTMDSASLGVVNVTVSDIAKALCVNAHPIATGRVEAETVVRDVCRAIAFPN